MIARQNSRERRWVGATVLAVGALLCLLALLPAAARAATGSISGTVTDAGTSEPIEGAEVCAWLLVEEEGWTCAETDALGEYTIEELEPGDYGVEFWAKPLGYVTEFYEDKARWWEADGVLVESGAVTGIDAEMAVGGSIEGTVTRAPGGEPVEAAEVCAWDEVAEYFAGCTFPDSAGEYAFRGLPAGEYIVEFWPYESDLLGQFYNGKSSPAEADLVPVTPPGAQSGIDAELQLGGTIEGTVRRASDGAPVQWVEACAWDVVTEFLSRCDFSRADGTYAIEGLSTGEYKVEFWTGESETDLLNQYWNHKANWSEADVLGVPEGGFLSGINADLLAPPPSPSLPPVTPPAVTPPVAQPPLVVPRKRKKCRRGFRKKRVKGKVRCVKVRKKRHHRRAGKSSRLVVAPRSFR